MCDLNNRRFGFMTNYRKILEMHSQGFSQRSIEANVHSSHQTVKTVLDRAKELNISCPRDDDITNEVLDELFYGKRKSSSTPYAVINYEYIHRELSKKGVTITLLWNEYCERAYANGEKPYMSTQFGDKYRRWARVTKATMRVTHKPGDTMQVDGMSKLIQLAELFRITIRSRVKSTKLICLSRLFLAAVISMSKPAPT